VHAARQHDRRLAVSLLAAAVAHTPEAEEALRGARMRTSRKPSAAARELLRNFPRSGGRRRRRRSRSGGQNGEQGGGDAGAREAEKAPEAEEAKA
jgi:ribonuclease E